MRVFLLFISLFAAFHLGQSAIATVNHHQEKQAEEHYRQQVRAGLITHEPETVWNISDRD